MTAVWFLMMIGWLAGGVAVLWKVAAVVLEVLREPLPPHLATRSGQAPVQVTRVSQPAVRVTRPTDDGTELFTRSRAAARPVRPVRAHPVADRSRPVAQRRPERTAEDTSTWADLLTQTLRELDGVRV